jgi:hypothetical protein
MADPAWKADPAWEWQPSRRTWSAQLNDSAPQSTDLQIHL